MSGSDIEIDAFGATDAEGARRDTLSLHAELIAFARHAVRARRAARRDRIQIRFTAVVGPIAVIGGAIAKPSAACRLALPGLTRGTRSVERHAGASAGAAVREIRRGVDTVRTAQRVLALRTPARSAHVLTPFAAESTTRARAASGSGRPGPTAAAAGIGAAGATPRVRGAARRRAARARDARRVSGSVVAAASIAVAAAQRGKHANGTYREKVE